MSGLQSQLAIGADNQRTATCFTKVRIQLLLHVRWQGDAPT